MSFDTIYKGSNIVTHNNTCVSDIAVKDGKIITIGDLSKESATQTIDITGYYLLPGVIDTQVHFREHGLEYKEDLNSGTNPSLEHQYVSERTQALFRLSGLEIIINVNFHNMKSIAGYTTTTSEIILQANEGWSSKGSLVTYMNYPNISMINNSYSYVDRYIYGFKFNFVISGNTGNFNLNNLSL